MDSILTNKITRDKLAKIFTNQEAIKLMENLTRDVGSAIPNSLTEVQQLAQMALTLAGQALLLAGDGNVEGETGIPGPRGQDGPPGATGPAVFFLSNDGEDGQDGMLSPPETVMSIAAIDHAATLKATPVNADEVTYLDSASSFSLVRTTWTSIKAFLKTYFDTLYTGNTGTVTSVAAITLGTTGTDLSSTVATGTTTPVITLQVPTASAANRGALSAADWTTFNGKQAAGTYVTPTTLNNASLPASVTTLTASGTVSIGGSFTTSLWATAGGYPGDNPHSYVLSGNGTQAATVGISLGRANPTVAGTGNDNTDGVGLWIGGFYQNVGGTVPLYLGRSYTGTNALAILDGGGLSPGVNGTQALGSTSLRWSQVWCTAGAFNTSDATLKTAVKPLTDIEKQAGAQFSREIGTFQWLDSIKQKGADNARHHVGMTVQRAAEILESFGLNPWIYGFMGYDKWDDEFVEHPAIEAVADVAAIPAEYVTDQVTRTIIVDGVEQTVTYDVLLLVKHAVPAIPAVEAKEAWIEQTKRAGDAYAFRYDQLNMFIAAGIEYRLSALEDQSPK